MSRRRALDDRLLDLVGAIEEQPFEGAMWRVVRAGRDVLDGSRGSGRWNHADMSVLYGAAEPDGAIAEIHFHLSRGQSVFPSRMQHDLFELCVKAQRTAMFADLAQLKRFGVDDRRYRDLLYNRTQEIGAAAAFLGFDGLIVPSARWNCQNIILFLDAVVPGDILPVSQERIDWAAWRKAKAQTQS